MGTTSQWLLKGQVIYNRFFDDVSLEDIANSGLENMRLLNDAPPCNRINLIMDGQSIQAYPRNLKHIRTVLNPALFARTDCLILVSDDIFQRHLGQFFAQLFHVRFYAASSLSEAYHFLEMQMAVAPSQCWPQESNGTIHLR